MKIQIATSELEYNIRSKSASELSHVPTEQRYQWQVGTEKMDEVRRCIVEAFAMLQETLSRFLRLEEDLGDIETDVSILPEVFVLDFQNSGRRTAGRGQTLADHCLSYLTDATLSKFYLSVSAMDMAEKRAKLAEAELQFITKLLYTKLPPRSIPTIPDLRYGRLAETQESNDDPFIVLKPGRSDSVGSDAGASRNVPQSSQAAPAVDTPKGIPFISDESRPLETEASLEPESASTDWEWVDTMTEQKSTSVADAEEKTEVQMMVCAHKDRILFSRDLGESYSVVNTISGSPFPTVIVNSRPAGCDFNKDGRAVSSHIARAEVYPSFGGSAAAAFRYDTLFELQDGTKKRIDTDATGNFQCYGSIIADSGRIAFFAYVKFKGEEKKKFRQLYTSASGWKVSDAWPNTAAGHICASDNFEVMACPGYISTDGGVTVRELPSSSSIKSIAVSGDGKVLYAVRKAGSCYLSVSADRGTTWKNILDLDAAIDGSAISAGTQIATNYDGAKIAVAIGNVFFAWSPDQGTTFETDQLGYKYRYNILSMDRSGYYVCVLNTTTAVISSYFGGEMNSRIYVKDMRTGKTTEPNINNGFTSLVSTVKLR